MLICASKNLGAKLTPHHEINTFLAKRVFARKLTITIPTTAGLKNGELFFRKNNLVTKTAKQISTIK